MNATVVQAGAVCRRISKLLAIAAVLLLYVGAAAAQAGVANFIIGLPNAQDGTGEICRVDPDGDLVFSTTEVIGGGLPSPTGRVVEANAADLNPQLTVAEFRVDRASDGATLMRVSASGTMFIRGSLQELTPTITPNASNPEFLVQAGGVNVMMLNLQGDLFLTGRVDCGCLHNGTDSNGSLTNDSSLPNSGPGYTIYLGSGELIDTEDWGCSTWAIRKCIEVGMDWRDNPLYSGQPLLQIGDISRRNGGSFPPHGTHRNGLQIDNRYVRSDGVLDRYNFTADCPNLADSCDGFDRDRTLAIMNSYLTHGATEIYVWYRANISGPGFNVRTLPNDHNDHFHVIFPKPAYE